MAADLNRVTLIGRLTRDGELRQTAGGTTVASIRLAVTSRAKQGQEWVDQPNYFDVKLFGRQAEALDKWLLKGMRVGVDGRLSWREWDAKDGSRRQTIEVIADTIQLLGDGQQRSESPQHQTAAPPSMRGEPTGAHGSPQDFNDDDIPF